MCWEKTMEKHKFKFVCLNIWVAILLVLCCLKINTIYFVFLSTCTTFVLKTETDEIIRLSRQIAGPLSLGKPRRYGRGHRGTGDRGQVRTRRLYPSWRRDNGAQPAPQAVCRCRPHYGRCRPADGG